MIGNCVERSRPAACPAKEKLLECSRCLAVFKADLAVEIIGRLLRRKDADDCLTLLDSLRGYELELGGYRRAVVDLVEGTRGLEIARQITTAMGAVDQLRQEICR